MHNQVDTPQSECLFAAARAEITPPVGIYHRMWGAAVHERATGIHRPLTMTVAVFCSSGPADEGDSEQIVIAIDHCLFLAREMEVLLERVTAQTGVPRERILFAFSHTHAAGFLESSRRDLPGGDLIEPYLESLAGTTGTLLRAARDAVQPVIIVYGQGRSPLAGQRDFYDDDTRQWVCGYHPAAPADDTLLVARVNSIDGRLLATLVNYACHPTTLSFENTLISPDYPGAMREVIEEQTGAPCLFLQGASGDLGPREGYIGGTELADRNGRQLGFAALAALEPLPPAGTTFRYAGPVVSGATLGLWRHVPADDAGAARRRRWRVRRFTVPLAYRPGLPTAEALHAERRTLVEQKNAAHAAGDALRERDVHALIERIDRQLRRLDSLPAGPVFPMPVTLWQMGDALWLAVEGEHYQWLQQTLRARCPGVPLWVITLANGSRPSYLPTRAVYDTGIYQETIALLAPGSLERLEEEVGQAIEAWVK